MAPVLGKRKARTSADDSASAEEIFRRHFEAQFKPLEALPPSRDIRVEEYDERSDSESSEESEWGGITDEEDGIKTLCLIISEVGAYALQTMFIKLRR